MSKNVAVFVDVANIFYAAKAAGVDIDYVTLLRASTAGRDFVRAYAYTGLDPENENQRQFHSFLARSGYKVVSKDIRKYGDGRIKANLDIELVVDLMRMADHIDIAVVVSGDGDFAPAIRAVQQMGVRVEVVSFRANTSSDLIEVADVFTDIAQVARVEKGTRSGRRIASEDDLSMTAVPEKETDLGPRRRRGRRGEGEERRGRGAAAAGPVEAAPVAAMADASGMPSNIIVLPGERLSRVRPGEAGPGEPEPELGEELEEGLTQEAGGAESAEGEARRRRRRRGGRGRGRGGRAEEGATALEDRPVGATPAAIDDLGEEEFLEDEVPAMPQHSTFGSVWDRQIGLPSAPRSDLGPDEEGLEDEPEVPEYLLAERRQQGRRRGTRGRGGRQGGGYQSAVDRERYGRGGGGGYGSGVSHAAPRSSGGQRGGGTPSRGPRPPQPQPVRTSSQGSVEPWSEVPPEVQELLRAELARRQAGGTQRPAPERAAAPPAAVPGVPGDQASETAPAARRPARRTRAAASPEAPAAEPSSPMAAEVPAPAEVTEAPKPARRRTTRSTTGPASETAAAGTPPVPPAVEAPAKPARKRSVPKPTVEASAEPPAETPSAEPAPAPKRRTTRSKPTAEPAES